MCEKYSPDLNPIELAGRAYDSAALRRIGRIVTDFSLRKTGTSFAVPAMLEHDRNPLEMIFQFERLPQTQRFVLRQRSRGVADVADEGLDQRTHSSILQRHDRDRPGMNGKIDRQYLELEVLACEMQHGTRLYCNKATSV